MLLAALLVLPACVSVHASRMGHRYPSRPADCEIIWENLDMAEAVVRYQTIGSVGIGSFVGEDVETSPKLREAIRVEACKVGADAVLIGANSASNDRFGRAAAVWLLHRRDSPPSWAVPGVLGVSVPAGQAATPTK